MVMTTHFQVGSRIESEGNYGTVRYVGDVPPTKGVWLGVDWDDSTRGKHNGSHQERHYFYTRHPTSGSFLRPQKANAGVAFIEALRDRYGLVEEEGGGVIVEDMYVKGSKQTTFVEVVGAEKVNKEQSDLDKILKVCLRNTHVNGVQSDDEISRICPNVEQLDVSWNLLPSWEAVSQITRQMQHLYQLNISANILAIPENAESLQFCFAKLKVLFANRVTWDWPSIVQCCKMWPLLEELHVCFNSISEITVPSHCLQNLKLLNLESNTDIKKWEHVLHLGKLPNLEILILNGTGIDHFIFPDCSSDEITSFFPKLKDLTVYRAQIQQWSSINELNKLQSLEDFKIRDNPLLEADKEMSVETVRSLMIAKIKKLIFLNRTEVSAEERKGAEYEYIKNFGLEWKAAGGNQDPEKNNPNDAFRAAHPRYMQFIQMYGAPEDSELVKKTSALKNSLIALSISCPQREDKKTITKKLPSAMTVQKVKALLQRLYKVDGVTMKLAYSSPQAVGQEYEFDNDLREIGYYAIEDGDTIIVSWT